MEAVTIRKHTLTRLLNFLFLIPFVIGFRPLFLRYSRLDLILYALGTVIIMVLIIFSNRSPYIILREDKMILNLHYYQTPEVHQIEKISLVERISGHSIRIHSQDYKPVRLNVNPGDIKKIVKILKEKGIRIS